LTDVFVPDENFFEFPFGASFAPDRIFAKFPEVLVLAHAAVAVGIAEGAIMDLVELAGAGVKQLFMTAPLAETERFKEGLARLDAELMPARADRGADRPCLAKSRATGRQGPDPRGGTIASGGLDHLGVRTRRRRLL
jgi:alkylation response protein AidB-like acyl-CoA dehydrogenase